MPTKISLGKTGVVVSLDTTNKVSLLYPENPLNGKMFTRRLIEA
jgi:hypothetical protein